MKPQVVIVGAGPAGLVTAIHLARQGLPVMVCEQAAQPPDKACGEGLMPTGYSQLVSLGVRDRLGPTDCHPLSGVKYIQEDGTSAVGRLPVPGGLGVRRTTLVRALTSVAAEAGAHFEWNCRVRQHDCSPSGVRLETSVGRVTGELLVAADGLHSPVRSRAGLDGRPYRRQRFGLRRHYRCRPWSDLVEVHLSPGAEAFVTPVSPDLVGVAFLWDRERWAGITDQRPDFDAFLACFPRLAERLVGAETASRRRGAGPLGQRAKATVAERLVLVGDAAGYLDAITGEGLSLAFTSAAALAQIVPAALALGADCSALRPYSRAHARLYRHYALVTGAVLAIARRPGLRGPLIRWLGRRDGRLDRLVAWGLA